MADIKDIKLGNTKYNIKIPSSRVKSMADYAKPSSKPSPEAIQQSDTLNAALGKLEYKADTNQTNISSTKDDVAYVLDKTGKNLINIADATMTEEGFVIDVTYINPLLAGSYVFSYTSNQEDSGDIQFKARIGITELAAPIITSKSGRNRIPFTIQSTADNISLYSLRAGTYSDFMICTEEDDEISPAYAQYALPNSDLTQLEQQDRNALVEQVNEGAKNLIPTPAPRTETSNTATVTFNADGSITAARTTATTSGSAHDIAPFGITLPIGKYVWSSGVNVPTTCTLTIDFSDGSHAYVNHDDAPYNYEEFEITATKNITHIYLWLGTETSSATYYPMICTEADWKISQQFVPYALPNTDLTRLVSELQKKAVKVYTYHVNPNESDPEDAVTYLDDATGLTPAKMGASSFSYGSWANAWFLPRPCVLKFDGTVDYYLNPNDYSKKTDGTASTIDSSNSTGNVMLEFPKIWVKRVNDGNGARTVSIAPVNVDGTYKCWSNINAEDKEVDHFYLPAYNGTIHSSKMRSLSGVTLDTTYATNYTRAQEVTAATANNPTGKNMWYTETWADMCLIFDLLYLMGKSLNLQGTFGNGLATGSETAMRAYVTGSLDNKGLFYGDISAQATGVKVLGMENLWGCRWHGVAGLINDNGTLKVKMTYGVADGSTTVGYNTTGSGYLNYGSTYGTNGFVKKMQADNGMGYKIIETAGSDATYYCDYYYTNNSQLNYALVGGNAGHGLHCGFCVDVGIVPAYAYWSIGAALSCRP